MQPAAIKVRRKRMSRTTLKRLTSIPAHKIRHNNRHFPAGALVGDKGGSSSLAQLKGELGFGSTKSLGDPDEDEEAEGSPQETRMDRRKRFLTMNNLKRVFRALDLSDDGYIDADEVYEAQKKLGGHLTRKEVNDVIWEVDDDMDGKLSLQDYLTTYRRARDDEATAREKGDESFEPRRFYSIVEFLLMDRDCSGEITLDEAMTTIFERQGADNLGDATQNFFKAAGVEVGRDPPPGATITFANYYERVGCAKPRVPTMVDMRRSFSTELRIRDGKDPAPKLRPSTSAGLLPILLNPPKRPTTTPGKYKGAIETMYKKLDAMAAASGGSPVVRSRSPPGSGRHSPLGMFGSGGRGMSRPHTVGGLSTSPLLSPSPGTKSKNRAGNLAGIRRTQSGGIAALKPIDDTGELAASLLKKVGHTGESVNTVKRKAANSLGVAHEIDGVTEAQKMAQSSFLTQPGFA